MIYNTIIKLKTSYITEQLNLTKKIKHIVKLSKITEGIINLYSKHTTAALYINDVEYGLQKDLLNLLDKLISEDNNYLHNKVDSNATAHLKAILIGNSITIPIAENKLQLGKWQNIYFVEFDGPRQREIYLKIMGE